MTLRICIAQAPKWCWRCRSWNHTLRTTALFLYFVLMVNFPSSLQSSLLQKLDLSWWTATFQSTWLSFPDEYRFRLVRVGTKGPRVPFMQQVPAKCFPPIHLIQISEVGYTDSHLQRREQKPREIQRFAQGHTLWHCRKDRRSFLPEGAWGSVAHLSEKPTYQLLQSPSTSNILWALTVYPRHQPSNTSEPMG